MISDDFGWFRTVLCDLRSFRMVPDNFEWYRMIPDDFDEGLGKQCCRFTIHSCERCSWGLHYEAAGVSVQYANRAELRMMMRGGDTFWGSYAISRLEQGMHGETAAL